MKRYTFEIIINEGSDEFWDRVVGDTTGCDLVLDNIKNDLDTWDAEVRLVKYEDK